MKPLEVKIEKITSLENDAYLIKNDYHDYFYVTKEEVLLILHNLNSKYTTLSVFYSKQGIVLNESIRVDGTLYEGRIIVKPLEIDDASTSYKKEDIKHWFLVALTRQHNCRNLC